MLFAGFMSFRSFGARCGREDSDLVAHVGSFCHEVVTKLLESP